MVAKWWEPAGKMLLTEHKKANMFSHAIMADVKKSNQHLHFSDNLKYSENLGMRTYSRFFKEVPQLNHSNEYCTWNSYSNSGLCIYFLIPSIFWGEHFPRIPPVACMLSSFTVTLSRCYFSYSLSLFFHLLSQKYCRAILQPIWHQQIYRMDNKCCAAQVGYSLLILIL